MIGKRLKIWSKNSHFRQIIRFQVWNQFISRWFFCKKKPTPATQTQNLFFFTFFPSSSFSSFSSFNSFCKSLLFAIFSFRFSLFFFFFFFFCSSVLLFLLFQKSHEVPFFCDVPPIPSDPIPIKKTSISFHPMPTLHVNPLASWNFLPFLRDYCSIIRFLFSFFLTSSLSSFFFFLLLLLPSFFQPSWPTARNAFALTTPPPWATLSLLPLSASP